MQRTVKELRGCAIRATDGEIGKVSDVLFDDEHWTIRYLVVDTGGWLTGRKVLITPLSFEQVDWDGQLVHVKLTRAEVESSPDVSTDQPVSRQYEARYFEYYGYAPYWGGLGLWGLGTFPNATAPAVGAQELSARFQRDPAAALSPEARESVQQRADPHLRSAKEVIGYRIRAMDGELGHVQDFLVNPATYQIDAIVIDTKNWWPGKQVAIPPEVATEVRWDQRSVHVRLSREAIQSQPDVHA